MTPRPVPVSDTTAAAGYAAFAVTRMTAIAREHGLTHSVRQKWGACSCTDGTHPAWPVRVFSYDEDDARAIVARVPRVHLITWSVWEGYSPAHIADRAESETRA